MADQRKFLILYRHRHNVGRLQSSIRDAEDFGLHENFVIIKTYEVHDDGTLTEQAIEPNQHETQTDARTNED